MNKFIAFLFSFTGLFNYILGNKEVGATFVVGGFICYLIINMDEKLKNDKTNS